MSLSVLASGLLARTNHVLDGAQTPSPRTNVRSVSRSEARLGGTDAEAAAIRKKIVKRLEYEVGARLRS